MTSRSIVRGEWRRPAAPHLAQSGNKPAVGKQPAEQSATADSNSPKVSVLVCTYNRAEILTRLLRSLAAQARVAGFQWDVVVVDNNSTDETDRTAADFTRYLPIRYVREARQGKSYALNAGLKRASDSTLVVFLDDDVVVPDGWLTDFVEFVSSKPRSEWFGARVLPDWQGGKIPQWLTVDARRTLKGYFLEYDLGPISRPYAEGDPLPIGAAMAMRTSLLERVGEFREDLGPRGRLRGTSEDTDIIERAIEVGASGFYFGELACLHYVEPARLRLPQFFWYGVGKGLNQYRAADEKGAASITRMSLHILRGVFQWLRGQGANFRICLVNAGIEWGRIRGAREQS